MQTSNVPKFPQVGSKNCFANQPGSHGSFEGRIFTDELSAQVKAYHGCLTPFALLSMICPMRNVHATLNRHRRLTLLSTALHHDRHVGTILRQSISLEVDMDIGIARTWNIWHPSCLLQRNAFSTGFVSVHGERPSAEYTKLRKESLESEFRHIVRTNSSKSVSVVCHFGPFLALYGAAIISFHALKLAIWQFFFRDIKEHAAKFRETLIRLGPFYIKDQIPLFPTQIAIKSIETELGIPVSEIFADISPVPIAAESLGQVYKGYIHFGEIVAVKIMEAWSLLNEQVRHMFDEIDYILEARNAERIASLYGGCPSFFKSRNIKGVNLCPVRDLASVLDGFTLDERKILRELLICNNGSIRWNSLERLIAAISEQASESSDEPHKSEENDSHPLGWKSFDMRAVVAATEDLLLFILSEKGLMVRVFLLRDIIRAADIFLKDEVLGCRLDAKNKARKTSESEDLSTMRRVINGFGSLHQAVKLAPEVWTAMFIRLALKPETNSFIVGTVSALALRHSNKFPETFWVCMSTLIHKLAKTQGPDNPINRY